MVPSLNVVVTLASVIPDDELETASTMAAFIDMGIIENDKLPNTIAIIELILLILHTCPVNVPD